MARKTLTPRLVDTLEVEDGASRTLYYDDHPDAPKGFALRVTSSGARAFYLIRTLKATGRPVWVHLGPADGSGLEAARTAAEVRVGQIAKDLNPNVVARQSKRREKAERLERAIAAGEWTVCDMVRTYVTTRETLDLVTAKHYLRMLRHDVEGTELGEMKARDVVREDVRRLVARIAKRAPALAWSVLQLLRWSFTWAQDEEVVVVDVDGKKSVRPRVERDPTRRVEESVTLNQRRVRERHMTDEEIAAYWSRLEVLPKTRSVFARAILLYGTRATETYKTRWADLQELDGDDPVWRIPAEHRKGKKGKKRSIDIPLTPLGVELFKTLRPITGHRKLVFVGQGISHKKIGPELSLATCTVEAHHVRVKPPTWVPKTYQPKKAHADPKVEGLACLADITIHDLRRTVSSGLQRLGAPPHIISTVLGHSREAGSVASDVAYAHDRRGGEHRLWLERWSNHVAALVAGERPGRKVVQGTFGGA